VHPIIRTALPADAPRITRVHIASWQTAYRGILPDAYLDQLANTYPERLARWEHGLRQAETTGTKTFVVETSEHGIVGFATAGPIRKPVQDYTGELYAIYLLAEHRRIGLGQVLFQRCVRHLRERHLSNMLVLVLEKNPARRFYEAVGGVVIPGLRIDLTIADTPVVEVAYGWAGLPGNFPETQGRDRPQDRAPVPDHVALETTTRAEDIAALHRQEIIEARNACDLTHAEIHTCWDQVPFRWFIVARSDHPIGFIAVQDQDGGGYISDLFVIIDARRLGLGGRLVQAVITQRPSQRLWLRVDPGNVTARRLYQRYGFREQRDDAGMIVMERQP
jgi:ribosomal protein S18 acetylase RimI-like enzyme